MSAIFGIYRLDGGMVSERHLKAMASQLAHRGPDSLALWRGGRVGLGYRALYATSQQAAERLPVVVTHGEIVLTADARIDNRRELLAALDLEERQADRIGDAELIVAAYERWGDRTPEHLVGDFAFALWDGREQTLLCARDHMGVRPLYYYHRAEGLFVFATEIKALLACQGVPCRLNENRVASHLLGDLRDTTDTFYHDIVRLPAAHILTVGQGSTRRRRYWTLDWSRELRLGSDGEYADAFREHLLEAVKCRIRGVFHLGSTLSGGLDSSSIACAANLLTSSDQPPLRTFSAIFPDLPERARPPIDERPYVTAVLEKGRFDPTYVAADQSSPLHDWHRVFWHLDEACLAPNLYMHWALYEAAAARNVRVLLDGLDGDTTVSHGLGFLIDLARSGRWFRFLEEAKALSQRYPRGFPMAMLVRQFWVRALLPDSVVRVLRAARRMTHDRTAQSVVSRELLRKCGFEHRSRPQAASSNLGSRREHWEGLNSPLVPYALELADRSSAAFAIEARYPFFDRRLIEFCLSIPGEQKLHQGWTRMVLRRGMAGVLPAAVQWRADKSDLSGGFLTSLFKRDRSTIERVVFDGLADIAEYVEAGAVRDAYRRWVSEPMARPQEASTLYAVATLALWLQVFRATRIRQDVYPEGAFFVRTLQTSAEPVAANPIKAQGSAGNTSC